MTPVLLAAALCAPAQPASEAPRLVVQMGHDGPVGSARFSPDGKKIVTASYDETAKVWDAATGKELVTLKGHTHWVRSASFSPARLEMR